MYFFVLLQQNMNKLIDSNCKSYNTINSNTLACVAVEENKTEEIQSRHPPFLHFQIFIPLSSIRSSYYC